MPEEDLGDGQRILMAFGERLRELRAARQISQAELAHAAGLHPTYVSGIERGRRNVSLVNIVALARALGITPADLLTGFERSDRA